jgi:hypothetical protein
VDIKRVALSAEEQENWIPRVLGSMMLRPGWEYKGATASNNKAKTLPFVFSTTDTALVELTDSLLRVRVGETLITRDSVSTAVTNGTFNTDVTGWTDSDESGGTSAWLTGGYLSLQGNGTNSAIREQTLTVAGGDQNVEHALRIVVTQGWLTLRIGSTSGGDEYFSETKLAVGTHSLAFTPTGASVYLRLSNADDYPTLVDSCTIDVAGVLTLPTPWATANLYKIRWDQSGDIIFCACSGVRPMRIERRSTRSWSIVNYVTEKGPFRGYNTSAVTLTPSALNGTITLTASKNIFKSTNVGGLFAIHSVGQAVTKALVASDTYSDPIRVTGIGASRRFGITITGTWVATIYLQQATDPAGPWSDVTGYTTNQSTTYLDALDNQILYYRLGITPAGYTSGTATVQLAYSAGSIKGIARITAYSSPTSVSAVVLKDFGALTASSDWAESIWSDRRGYPSGVAFHDGRLWFGGKDKILGSVSDDYTNFDEDYEGDAGPIIRSIGSGPVDEISWMVSARNLVVGAQGAERVIRSTTFGEPITPTNFNMPEATTYGSAAVGAVKVDKSVVFVDRSESRVMETAYDNATAEFNTEELTSVTPELCRPSVVAMAVQRRPDTRIHCVLSDGTVALLIFDKNEDVKCWVKVSTSGSVEDVVVLPGTEEDLVYYTVLRGIDNSDVRYLERWAKESECVGGSDNKQADAFYHWSGASSTAINGLNHLENATVVCWANGKYQGAFVVTGGGIVLPEAVTSAVVGLTYQARFKSTKLANNRADGSTTLTSPMRVDHVGFVLANTHYQGLQYGTDYNYLDDLPLVSEGLTTPANTVWDAFDQDSVELNDTFTTDKRLCLVANAPKPCTVLATLISKETHTK